MSMQKVVMTNRDHIAAVIARERQEVAETIVVDMTTSRQTWIVRQGQVEETIVIEMTTRKTLKIDAIEERAMNIITIIIVNETMGTRMVVIAGSGVVIMTMASAEAVTTTTEAGTTATKSGAGNEIVTTVTTIEVEN
jgi:hypothetical protein